MADKVDKALPMREGEQALVDTVNTLIDEKTEVNSIAPLVVENTPTASNGSCVAVGQGATASGSGTIAIGQDSTSNGYYSITMGINASTAANYSVAIGALAQATEKYTFSVGRSNSTRRIVNVTNPVNPQDAVTKNYLDARISESLATYLASLPDIEYGYIDVGTIAGGGGTVTKTITFASTKTEAPSVFVTPYVNTTNAVVTHVQAVSTTSATVIIRNVSNGSISNVTLDWLAISGR